jgi:hypothetical protein
MNTNKLEALPCMAIIGRHGIWFADTTSRPFDGNSPLDKLLDGLHDGLHDMHSSRAHASKVRRGRTGTVHRLFWGPWQGALNAGQTGKLA